MNRFVARIRISQLPLALFGIIFAAAYNGIRMSIYAYTNTTIMAKDSPALT
ncbi:Uncharacterised protein [Chlamydia abortus]|jgi:hypothetical protein|uniref:MFS transporter n=1 Tax=Paenibacillus residui TaxID=629724 RepID=A0ABW3D7K7_9BACL|nr:hypothetical protein [Paenibacillus sp. 32O-W]SHE12718.1 Uncharacterised protein [Chlamydia abortus]